MTTADVRDMARDKDIYMAVLEAMSGIEPLSHYTEKADFIAKQLPAALAAKGLTIVGAGQVAVSREDVEFIVSHMWVTKREAHDHAGMVQDRLKAALSAASGEPTDG
jgi:hypothetical protein